MQNAGQWLQAIGQWFMELWSTHPLSMMLLSGLLLLAILLFVLMRTRLGQIKPLWTCAALSILAHILLAGYFYGTTLISAVPAKENEVVKFQLIEHSSDSADSTEKEDEESSSLPEKPWETQPVTDLTEPTEDLDPVQLEPISSPIDFNISPPELETPQLAVDSDMTQEIKNFQPTSPELPIAEIPVEEQVVDSRSTEESNVPAVPLEITAPPENLAETQEQIFEGDIVPDLPQAQPESFSPEEMLPIEPRPKQVDLNDALQHLAETPFPNPLQNGQVESPKDVVANTNPAPEELQPDSWRPANSFGKQKSSGSNRVPVQPATMVRSGDGKPVPAIYKARTEPKSTSWLELAGGSAETQLAVEAALQFLSDAQEEDGRWDASRFGGGLERHVLGHDRRGAGQQADTAVTSLTVLAMMAAGNTHLDGTHAKSVQRGLEYLLSVQKVDGNMAGDALLFSQMYCHSMSTLALSEAYAMTGDRRLHDAVQRAVNYTLRAQNYQDGGWRYRPGDAGDMSQFGWHVMSLKSAKLAGIDIPDGTWQRMKTFLDSCCSGQHNGHAAYRPGQGASRVMTAEALVCRFFLDANPNQQLIDEAVQVVNGSKPGSDSVNYYYWYYGTLAMNLAGGQAWDAWNEAMSNQLLSLQRQDGVLKGSFDANGVWSGYGGRIYSTAMATLCLESYYRYLPALKSDDNR